MFLYLNQTPKAKDAIGLKKPNGRYVYYIITHVLKVILIDNIKIYPVILLDKNMLECTHSIHIYSIMPKNFKYIKHGTKKFNEIINKFSEQNLKTFQNRKKKLQRISIK